jgi:hypothetical protein
MCNDASVVAEKPKFNVKWVVGRGREAQFYANHASVVAEKPKLNIKSCLGSGREGQVNYEMMPR